MKAKVMKRFIDKETKELRKEDEVITVTKKRFNEILKAGKFVEEIEDN